MDSPNDYGSTDLQSESSNTNYRTHYDTLRMHHAIADLFIKLKSRGIFTF